MLPRCLKCISAIPAFQSNWVEVVCRLYSIIGYPGTVSWGYCHNGFTDNSMGAEGSRLVITSALQAGQLMNCGSLRAERNCWCLKGGFLRNSG